MTTQAIYEVVTEKGTSYYESLEALARDYRIRDFNAPPYLRKELQGQPRLYDLLGPMYGGYRDDTPIIRYETQRVYDILSQ